MPPWIAILLLASLTLTIGSTDVARDEKQVFVSTEHEVVEAFQRLETSQMIIFTTSSVQLRKTLVIATSDVIIKGVAGGTTLLCPESNGTLEIRGEGVRLEELQFKGCKGNPAVRVIGSYKPSDEKQSDVGDEKSFMDGEAEEEYTVSFKLCKFEDNTYLGSDLDSKEVGSAIFAQKCQLMVDKCTFANNSALNGGAILAKHSRVVVQGSRFTGNDAGVDGGAISGEASTMEITESVFADNSAKKDGGAVKGSNGVVIIHGSAFTGNRAKQYGGAVMVFSSKMTVVNSTFGNNSVDEDGGAVNVDTSTAEIEDSVFEANNASTSGGATEAYKSTVFIRGSRFVRNRAEEYGGAIVVLSKSNVTVLKSTFDCNSVDLYGGAISSTGSEVEINESVLVGNCADKGRGGAVNALKTGMTLYASLLTRNFAFQTGGALNAFKGDISMKNTMVENNSAKDAGGVRTRSTTAVVQGCTFTNNSALENGGVVLAFEGVMNISGSMFANNYALTDGGAVHVWKNTLAIRESTFVANCANRFAGAVLGLQSTITVSGSVIDDNFARKEGGGFRTERSDIKMQECNVTRNLAGVFGGAAFGMLSNIIVTKSWIINNSAGQQGGGFDAQKGNLTVQGCMFIGNSATSVGGGVLVGQHNATVHNCVFDGNIASIGGGIRAYKSALAVKESNFTNNSATEKGGALGALHGQLTITDSNFLDNKAEVNVGAAKSQKDRFFSTSQSQSVRKPCREGLQNEGSENLGGALSSSHILSHGCAKKLNGLNCRSDAFSSQARVQRNAFAGPAEGGAAAIFVEGTVVVHGCIFERNQAGLGGAIHFSVRKEEAVTMNLTNSTFNENVASSSGGAMAVSARGVLLNVSDVIFSRNSAKAGGAVSVFQEGACFAAENSSTVVFVNNSATDGGGLLCAHCGQTSFEGSVRFLDNVAYRTGGGVFFSEGGQLGLLGNVSFEGNVAETGGGAAVVDSRNVTLGLRPGSRINFYNNSAVVGGALYIRSERAVSESYTIVGCEFEANTAIGVRGLEAEHRTTLDRCIRKKTSSIGEDGLGDSKECTDGRGGAFYFEFDNTRDDSSVALNMTSVNVRQNWASVGGGGYIKMNPNTWEEGTSMNCTSVQLPSSPRCRSFYFQDVKIYQNAALIDAGGLYLSSSRNLSSLCAAGAKHSQQANETSVCVTVKSNTIEGAELDDPGRDIGSDAVRLELLNVRGSLECLSSGKALGVPIGECPSSKINNIEVAVKDMHDRTIKKPIKDHDLSVILESDNISGQRLYRAQKGVINITSTSVVGIEIEGRVTIRSDDDRRLELELNFTTRSCIDGELIDLARSACFRCEHGKYSLDVGDCRPCEEHANCIGTAALIPEEGYWHSAPFSPFFHRCLLKEACVRENRTEDLLAYYKDSDSVMRELGGSDENNEDTEKKDVQSPLNYTQCAEEYNGTLCGSCVAGYGRSGKGMCVVCRKEVALSIAITILAGLFALAVYTFKLTLAVNGTKTDALSAIDEARRVIHHASEAVHLQGSSSESDEGTSNANMEAGDTSGRRPSEAVSVHKLNRRRLIMDPISDADSAADRISRRELAASGILTDTFNIAFNSLQLSSLALSLDIDWGEALNVLLSVQNSTGRITGIFHVYPFECNFKQERLCGTSKVMFTLWYRACFPMVAIAIYLAVIQFWRLRPKPKTKRGELDLVPPMVMVFLVVFLSSMIDIVGEFLRVLNCEDMSVSNPNHDYAVYDSLDARFVWKEDTSVTCYEGGHLAATVLASIGMFGCLLVLAFSVAIVLYGKRKDKLGDEPFILSYGFLYSAYRRDGVALYWESVITIRKILMAAVGVFMQYSETSNLQIGVMATILFVSVAAQSIVHPFDHDDSTDTFPLYAGWGLRYVGAPVQARRWVSFNQSLSLNSLETSSLFISLSLYITGMALNGNPADDALSIILLVTCSTLNYAFFAFMAYRVWCAVHNYLDVLAGEKGVKFQGKELPNEDCDTWLALKGWTLLKAMWAEDVLDDQTVADDLPNNPVDAEVTVEVP